MAYKAPVRDLTFILNEVLEIGLTAVNLVLFAFAAAVVWGRARETR